MKRWVTPLALLLATLLPTAASRGPGVPQPGWSGSSCPTRLAAASTAWPGRLPTGSAGSGASRSIVENKAGAATMLGGADVARSQPDGHTLLLTSDSSITSNPHLFKKMLYDPIAELAPVTQLIDLHQFVLVHPSVNATTMKELVALAKEKPNTLNYGSYGTRQPASPAVRNASQGDRRANPAGCLSRHRTRDHGNLAGEVQMTLGSVAVAAGHIEAGKIEGPGDRAPGSDAGVSERPDLARGGLRRHRAAVVVRPVRARRHAAGGGRKDPEGRRRLRSTSRSSRPVSSIRPGTPPWATRQRSSPNSSRPTWRPSAK